MQLTAENYMGTYAFDRFTTAVNNAIANDHKFWVGNIPVSESLLAFYKGLKSKRYNIAPCVDDKPKAAYGDAPYFVFRSLSIVFTEATEFRVGVITAVTNTAGDMEFLVESNKIENEKFVRHSPGFHIRKSKDMAKALKIALKVFVPLEHSDVRDRCTMALTSGLNDLRSPAQQKLYSKLSFVRVDAIRELTHMIASGYAPITTAFQEALDLIRVEGAELKRMQEYKPRACFVWIKSESLSYKMEDENTEPTECTSMNAVPEVIRNKLAVLQIANNGGVIADVGIRVSDKLFWIFM